jgi:hypothetical protein
MYVFREGLYAHPVDLNYASYMQHALPSKYSARNVKKMYQKIIENRVMRNVHQHVCICVIYISVYVCMWLGTKHGGISCVMLFTGRAADFLEFPYFTATCS